MYTHARLVIGFFVLYWAIDPSSFEFVDLLFFGALCLLGHLLSKQQEQSRPMSPARNWFRSTPRSLPSSMSRSLSSSMSRNFDDMTPRSLKEREDRHMLFRNLKNSRNWQEAVELFADMSSRGSIAPRVYNGMIDMLGKAGQQQQALALLDEMVLKGVEPQPYSLNAAIHACCVVKDCDTAIKLVEKFDGAWQDSITLGALSNTCLKSNRWDLSLEIFEKVRNNTEEPDEVILISAISACGPAQDWRKAIEIFGYFDHFGMTPSVIGYGSLVNALAKNTRWQDCETVLATMKEKNVAINVVIFNTVLNAYSKSNKCQKAIALFESAESLGIVPDIISYNCLIKTLFRSQQRGEVVKYFIELLGKNMTPQKATYEYLQRCSTAPEFRTIINEVQKAPDRRVVVPKLTRFHSAAF